MPAWVWIVAAAAIAWCVFVAVAHPFRRGAHAARRGEARVVLPVTRQTVPVARVAGAPPWATGLTEGQSDPLMVAKLERISESLRDRYGPGSMGTWTPRNEAPLGSRLADTGDVMDAHLAADVTAFMSRQDAEVAADIAVRADECRAYVRALAVAL